MCGSVRVEAAEDGWVIPDVIQQTLDEFRRKPHSLAFCRARDGLCQLTTGHSRNKIIAAIDQFGQTGKRAASPRKSDRMVSTM